MIFTFGNKIKTVIIIISRHTISTHQDSPLCGNIVEILNNDISLKSSFTKWRMTVIRHFVKRQNTLIKWFVSHSITVTLNGPNRWLWNKLVQVLEHALCIHLDIKSQNWKKVRFATLWKHRRIFVATGKASVIFRDASLLEWLTIGRGLIKIEFPTVTY